MAGSKRSGGPRTEKGKDKAKRNATKHGIFSDVVVLEGESRARYDALLDGFFKAFRPVGALEESLVESLVAIRWRQRRFLIAESAEIEAGRAAVRSDEQQRQIVRSITPSALAEPGGLISKIDNSEALEVFITRLGLLRMEIETGGVDYKRDSTTLEDLYGELGDDHWQLDLHYSYRGIAATASLPADVRKQRGLESPEDCATELLKLVDDEQKKLERFRKERIAIKARQLELEELRQNVPASPKLDLLLRYSTALDRNFDRTLSQLDRAQATRLGQPVAPKIDVSFASS